MNHLETATDEVKRHLMATRQKPLRKHSGMVFKKTTWKDAHEAAAKYLKLKPAKVTRIMNIEEVR